MTEQPKNKNKPLKQLAYECIKEKILSCEYKPGLYLNEQQVCADIGGISRTPVRDALGRLEQEGLLNILPKKGVIISELQIYDINRIYEVRMLLEPYALSRYGNKLNPDEFNRFALIMSSQDPIQTANFYELDDRFHGFIMSAIPNPYLMDTYENISNMNQRLRVLSGSLVKNRIADTFAEHMVIIDSCLEQKWDKAAGDMTAHLEKSRIATFKMIAENKDNF